MEQADAAVTELETQLADPDLWMGDAGKARQLQDQLDKARATARADGEMGRAVHEIGRR